MIYREVVAHESPVWISAEGTNVVPSGMPGDQTMETYLAKMYDHGAVLVNIFSWGIGGPAYANNMFRVATENKEAVAAYRKFLEGKQLVELPPSKNGFSALAFQLKIREIQKDLSAWVRRTHGEAAMKPLVERLDGLLKTNRFVEADHVADEILALLHTQ